MRLSLEHSVLATVHYFDLMDFAPTAVEIQRFLFGYDGSRDEVEDTLPFLEEVHRIGGFYCLEGRESLVEKRLQSMQASTVLWDVVKKNVGLFESCPFIKMVAVCNTLAYGNAKPTSDIDLFIVTESGALWQTRLLLKVLTQLRGVRMHHEKRAGRFCLSFMVTEDALSLQNVRLPFDPHLAYFVSTAVPIVGHDMFRKWQTANAGWTRDYLPQANASPSTDGRTHRPLGRTLVESFSKPLRKTLENLSTRLQRPRDEKRLNVLPSSEGVIMGPRIFKFHEKDTRQEIADNFAQRLRAIVSPLQQHQY